MIEKRTWEEFRKAGLLWFINGILHMFGWAITFDMEDGKVVEVYPARVKFRGFSEKSNEQGYIKVTDYLKDNIDQLVTEVHEGEGK